MVRKMINYPLFHNKVDIKAALHGVASQENCDGPEYDLMVCAAEYIQQLEEFSNLIYVSVKIHSLDPDLIQLLEDKFCNLLR